MVPEKSRGAETKILCKCNSMWCFCFVFQNAVASLLLLLFFLPLYFYCYVFLFFYAVFISIFNQALVSRVALMPAREHTICTLAKHSQCHTSGRLFQLDKCFKHCTFGSATAIKTLRYSTLCVVSVCAGKTLTSACQVQQRDKKALT